MTHLGRLVFEPNQYRANIAYNNQGRYKYVKFVDFEKNRVVAFGLLPNGIMLYILTSTPRLPYPVYILFHLEKAEFYMVYKTTKF